MTTQLDKTMTFRARHGDGRVLVLPNAWDVASACVAAAVDVPVTADIEGGYGSGPEEVATPSGV